MHKYSEKKMSYYLVASNEIKDVMVNKKKKGRSSKE